jgi:light-harvesting protein B-800-850 beta chain
MTLAEEASGCASRTKPSLTKRKTEMSDPNKVWPTGLTEAESEELHRNIIQGTQIFGAIAALAHLLAYIYTPWLH